MSWKFVRFHEFKFQTEPESFSFLSWKTKKFIPKKNIFWAVPPRCIQKMELADSIFQKVLIYSSCILPKFSPTSYSDRVIFDLPDKQIERNQRISCELDAKIWTWRKYFWDFLILQSRFLKILSFSLEFQNIFLDH